MLQRCRNANNSGYAIYGERGITVCPRWEVFENFLADMGERPDGMTLDRIDNDGHYEPDNCRWATPSEQSNNRRDNRLITFDGVTTSIGAWEKRLGLPPNLVRSRLAHGWSVEKALTTPVR
jgi:hypothetical protein